MNIRMVFLNVTRRLHGEIAKPKYLLEELGRQVEALVVRLGKQIIIEYKRSKIQSHNRVNRRNISIGRFIEYMNYAIFESSIQGKIEEDSTKPYIIVVSHEASRTGAPILALNICRGLSNKYNIISILLGDGPLKEDFRETSTIIIEPRVGILTSYGVAKHLKRMKLSSKPVYAIVNSIVSKRAISPLRSNGIPVITLIHEFSTYIRPKSILDEAGLWSNRIVFSSDMTRDDIINNSQCIIHYPSKIIPQGKCVIPNKVNGIENQGKDEATKFLESIGDDCILILGAGQIQPRKGIDLFIITATKIECSQKDKQIVYVWLGSGFDPENDFDVSLWLDDQIEKSGMRNKIFILDDSYSYPEYVERAKVFLMTSRLDPFPNVGIDAMFNGKPMICFDKACGIASLLKTDQELSSSLISGYLDTDEMANKAIDLIQNNTKYEKISRLSKNKADEWFNMEKYIEEIDSLGQDAMKEEIRLLEEIEYLEKNMISIPGIYKNQSKEQRRDLLRIYLLKWRKNLWPKKPEAGFHPGIYRESNMENTFDVDPYIHYLESGRPKGIWKNELIKSTQKKIRNKSHLKVALHIHVHYVEILDEILNALTVNTNKPDIFITYNKDSHKEIILKTLNKYKLLANELIKTPNRGRDIGPLLTDLGRQLDITYDVHGHIHTKKSIHMEEESGKQWRNFLITNLIGSEDIAMMDHILDEFEIDERLGLVFPDDPTCVGWTKNIEEAKSICKTLSISSIPENFNFPVGTMFWVKKGALTKLYELEWKWDDYPLEPLPNDGTILHAIERLVPIIVNKQGYNYKLTYVSGADRE